MKGFSPILFITLVHLVSHKSLAAKLPSEIKKCSSKDPLINECLKTAIEESLKLLKNGNAALKIPPIDPMRVPHFSSDSTETNKPISVKLQFTDQNITGLSDLTVKELKYDQSEKQEITGKVFLPSVVMNGKYSVEGSVLILPIYGKGQAFIDLENLDLDLYMKLAFTERKGKKYLNLNEIKLKVTELKNLKVKLGGLFNGNDQLSDRIHEVLAENQDAVRETFEPPIVRIAEVLFKSVTDQVFKSVPYKDLLIGAE